MERELKTFALNATCGFNWYHFQVKAKTFKGAYKKLEPLDGYDLTKEEIKAFVKKNPDIVDISIDEDDLDYGCKYFDLRKWRDEFEVKLPFEDSYHEFNTKEEALKFIENKLKKLDNKYKVVDQFYRGYRFIIMEDF